MGRPRTLSQPSAPSAPRSPGTILDLEKKITRQRAALANLDATIRLCSPGENPDTIPPRRPCRRTRDFAGNELSRLVMTALRLAFRPLTAARLAAVIRAKEMSQDDVVLSEMVLESDSKLKATNRLTRARSFTDKSQRNH